MLQEGKYGAAVCTSEGDVNIAVLESLGVDHWGDFKGTPKGMKDWGAGQGGWSEFCGRLCPILGQCRWRGGRGLGGVSAAILSPLTSR